MVVVSFVGAILLREEGGSKKECVCVCEGEREEGMKERERVSERMREREKHVLNARDKNLTWMKRGIFMKKGGWGDNVGF